MRRVKTKNPAFHNKLDCFIWPLFPFVCQNKPYVCAFVGIKIPLVGNRKNTGFTIIELMVVVVMVSILGMLALPAMNSFIMNGRIRSVADNLAGTLNLARTEAVTDRQTARICIRARSVDDSDNGCTGSDWAKGWIAWEDADGDGSVDAGEKILRKVPLPKNAGSLEQNVTVALTDPASGYATLAHSWLRFGLDGALVRADATENAGLAFLICDSTRAVKEGRLVEIAAVGRVSVTKSNRCT